MRRVDIAGPDAQNVARHVNAYKTQSVNQTERGTKGAGIGRKAPAQKVVRRTRIVNPRIVAGNATGTVIETANLAGVTRTR